MRRALIWLLVGLLALLIAPPTSAQPPACTPSATRRCPLLQAEHRGGSPTPYALATDRGRRLAIAAGQDSLRPALVAFDTRSGQRRWAYSTEERGQSRSVVISSNGVAFVGGQVSDQKDRATSTLTALDAGSGRPVWRHRFPQGPHILDFVLNTLLSPDQRTVYTAGVQALSTPPEGPQRYTLRVTAHDSTNGHVRWTWALPGVKQAGLTGVALVADGRQLLLSGWTFTHASGARVLALDTTTGRTRWQGETPMGNLGSLAVNQRGDLVATATEVGGPNLVTVQLAVRRTSDGRLLWQRRLGDPENHMLPGGLAFSGDHLISGGHLQQAVSGPVSLTPRRVVPLALAHDSTGRELWRTTLPSPSGAATADRVTAFGDRVYVSGEQDDRPLVQVGTLQGSAMLWRVDPISGLVRWTGVTRGTGDPPQWDVGQRTVGVVAGPEEVWSLVRHRDPEPGGGTTASAFLLQRWTP